MPAERPTHSSSGLWPGPSISSGALPVPAQAPAPAQTPAPSVSTRPQKPPNPARTVKLVSKSNWEDEEQFRQRVSGNWDVPMTSAGLKKGGKRKKQKEDSKKKSTKGNH